LEAGNRILGETVAAQINGTDSKREPIDVRLCDFDDVSYRIVIDAKAKNLLQVSLGLPCYQYIKDLGAEDSLKAAFGDHVIPATDGFDVTVQVDLDKEEKKEELVKKLTLLKPYVLGGVFKYFFTKLQKNEQPAPFKFDLRRDTTVYFIPDKDRVVTVFGLDFSEKVDKAVAKIFMQEFADVRKTIGYAPPVSWSVPPPSELKVFGITEKPTGNLGFFSLAILKDHVAKDDLINKIVDVLQSFRTYLQYHIKCSKSYFHSRMRARAKELLKVLNRAKQVDPEQTGGKRTVHGKTFTRAV